MALIVLSKMSISWTLLAKKAEFSMSSSGHSSKVSKSKSFICFKLNVAFRDLLIPNCFIELYLLSRFISTGAPVNSRTYFLVDLWALAYTDTLKLGLRSLRLTDWYSLKRTEYSLPRLSISAKFFSRRACPNEVDSKVMLFCLRGTSKSSTGVTNGVTSASGFCTVSFCSWDGAVYWIISSGTGVASK